MSHLLTASRLSLRFSFEISQAWLTSFPGFPILLRNQDLNLTQPWILQPNEYAFVQADLTKKNIHKIKTNNVLILLHHNRWPDWQQLLKKFPDQNLYWTFYNMTSLPSWPLDQFVSFGEILANSRINFDAFYDSSSWLNDTVSPIHLHLLHNFISWSDLSLELPLGTNYQEVDVYYGKFLLFRY